MTPSISAVVFAIAALVFACAILRVSNIPFGRPFVVWLSAAILLFVIQTPAVVLPILGLIAIAAAPIERTARAAFYLAVVPSLPVFMQADIPFPGINFLAIMSFERIAAFGILLPLLFYSRAGTPTRANWVDACILGYAAYTAAIVGGAINITSGLRFFADAFVLLAVPYFVLSRAAFTREDLDTLFKGFLVSAVFLAAIAFAATAKQWDFYRLLEPPSAISVPDFRGGWLRIGATTTNPHALGYWMAIAILLLEALKDRMNLGFIRLMMLRGMFFVALLTTGSRGALGGLIVALAVLTVLKIRSRAVQFLLASGAVFAVLIAAVWLYTGDSAKVDPYGTFQYRQQMIKTSLEFIRDHFLFGDLNYLNSGRFDHLVQGQGIVDITNYYLQVALAYGMVGFALIFAVILWPAWKLLLVSLRGTQDDNSCVVMLAAIVGWLALIATTSDVGLTLYLGIVLAALGRATYALHAASARTQAQADPAPTLAVAARIQS